MTFEVREDATNELSPPAASHPQVTTEPLFLRAATLIDSSAIEMDVQLPSYEGTQITAFAETAVITVAFQITELGGKAIGRPVVYLPDAPVLPPFALVGAYSQYVAAILTGHLKDDGYQMRFQPNRMRGRWSAVFNQAY